MKPEHLKQRIPEIQKINRAFAVFGFPPGKPERGAGFFDAYRIWLACFEKALLKIWFGGRDDSAGKLDESLNAWLDAETLRKGGFFESWANLCAAAQPFPPAACSDDPETSPADSLLFHALSDRETWRPVLNGEPNARFTRRACKLFGWLRDFERSGLKEEFFSLLPEDCADFLPEPPNAGEAENSTDGEFPWAKLREVFLASRDWEGESEKLLEFWKANSGGTVSTHRAFLFEPGRAGMIEPVTNARNVRFRDLLGVAEQREKLMENAEKLIGNGTAHHALLWGHRGSGKSSSVLALLNEFAERGLKLVEVRRNDLNRLNLLLTELGKLPEKFIVFIDDLSFEIGDESYKQLKILMDGGLRAPGRNLMLAVTCNRKSLMDATEGANLFNLSHKRKVDEIRALDDRFALKLFYDGKAHGELRAAFNQMAAGRIAKNPEDPQGDKLFEAFQKFCFENQLDAPSFRGVDQFLSSLPRL